jgi:hypothetical protein
MSARNSASAVLANSFSASENVARMERSVIREQR